MVLHGGVTVLVSSVHRLCRLLGLVRHALLSVRAGALRAQQPEWRGTLGWGVQRGGEGGGGEGGGTAAKVMPELSSEKVVKYGVEAAAEAGQAQGKRVEPTHGQLGGAVGHDALGHHQVQQEVDVIGGEADQEEDGAAEDHLQSAPLLRARLVPSIRVGLGAERVGSRARRGPQAAVAIARLSLPEGAGDDDGAVAYAG